MAGRQKSGPQNLRRDGARRGEGAIEPPLFLRTRRVSRVRGASAQVFARVSLANHLSWSGVFWVDRVLSYNSSIGGINATYGTGGGHRCSSESRLDSGASGKAPHA